MDNYGGSADQLVMLKNSNLQLTGPNLALIPSFIQLDWIV